MTRHQPHRARTVDPYPARCRSRTPPARRPRARHAQCRYPGPAGRRGGCGGRDARPQCRGLLDSGPSRGWGGAAGQCHRQTCGVLPGRVGNGAQRSDVGSSEPAARGRGLPEAASAGYRCALAAHRASKKSSRSTRRFRPLSGGRTGSRPASPKNSSGTDRRRWKNCVSASPDARLCPRSTSAGPAPSSGWPRNVPAVSAARRGSWGVRREPTPRLPLWS